jgi:hypothetical protein
MTASLPVTRDLAPASVATVVAAAAVALGSTTGLVRASDGRYDASQSVLVSPGADMANLLVVLVVLAAMSLARRGSLTGLLVWPGAVFYLLYAYVPYLVGAAFTPLVLAYVVVVLAAVFALAWTLTSVDGAQVRLRFAAAPARGVGAALVVVAVLAYAGLLGAALDAFGSTATEAAWRGHWVADWALGTPAMLLGGVLLWRRWPFGYVVGPGLLLVSGLGGVAFAGAATIDNVSGGLRTDWSVVIVHVVISAASFAVLGWYLRRRTRAASAAAPGYTGEGVVGGQRGPRE